MKSKSLFIILLSGVSICAQAQSYYVRAGFGAAISTSPRIGIESTSLSDSGYLYKEDAKRVGLANGLPIVAAAGYYFGNNFGVELGVDYFAGFNVKPFLYDQVDSWTSKGRGSMLSIVPAIVIRINNDKLKPYARLGVMIGVLNKVLLFETNNPSTSNSESTTSKDYGGIAIGAQAALGTELPLSKLFSLFGEVNFNAISWAPTKGKYIKDTYNGVDQLPDLTTKEKTWIYVKNLDTSQTIPNSDPNKQNLVNYSFSNIGLIVGVKLNFGK
jgi:hypothetical protein